MILIFGFIIFLSFPIFYICIKKRLANYKMQEDTDYYRNLFKENKTINLLIDPQTGYIKDANNTALNFYGYNKEEMLKKNH